MSDRFPDFFGWDEPPDPDDKRSAIWLSFGLVAFAVIVVAVTPVDASGGWRLFTWGLLLVAVADFARIVSRRL